MSFHKSLGLPDKNPKTVLIYLVLGTFGLTLASDALSDLVLNRLGKWLETHWGLNPIAFRLLLFGAIASGIVLLIWLTNWWELLTSRPGTIAPEPLKETLPGLIAVASKTPSGVKSAAQAAIEHHWTEGKGNLQHCWIICGGTELEGYARYILSQISDKMQEIAAGEYLLSDRENPKRQLHLFLRTLPATKVDNPNATFLLVNEIYREALRQGLEEPKLIADYTGGTKSMTAGMILACASPERRLQFMRPGGYTEDGRADTSLPSIATEVKVAFKLKSLKVE